MAKLRALKKQTETFDQLWQVFGLRFVIDLKDHARRCRNRAVLTAVEYPQSAADLNDMAARSDQLAARILRHVEEGDTSQTQAIRKLCAEFIAELRAGESSAPNLAEHLRPAPF
jgi:hypothetical protein